MFSSLLRRPFPVASSPWAPLSAAAVMTATLLLAGCGKKGKAANAPAGGPPPRNVLVAKVITRDSPLYLDEIGSCTAVETVQVQAQVSGQITERHFQDGQDVKKGDLLFTIDPRPYQAALDQAEGQLAQARAQLQLDQLNLQRQVDLQKQRVVAQQDLDTARAAVATDQARIQTDEAAVATAKINLDYCTIRSPIDGRAGLRQVDVGNVVSGGNGGGGGATLVTIQRYDPIYTDFTVAESDLPQVRRYLSNPNLRVQTDAPDDQAAAREGKLYFIDNAVQSGAGTVRLRGLTDNPDKLLWPGEFVRVKLVLDTLKDARLVPSGAVQIGAKGPFVFVVKPDSTVDLRPVQPGQRQEGDLTVIRDGLQPGETVVVTGQLQLAPGAKVNAKDIGEGGSGVVGGGGSAAGGAKASAALR